MKSSVFSTISLAVFLFLFLLSVSSLCNLFLRSAASITKLDPQVFPPPQNDHHRTFKSVSSPLPLLSVKEEANESYHIDDDLRNSVISPSKITVTVTKEKKQRAAFFRRTLQGFNILPSTGLTLQFARRVREFFDSGGGCEVQFFMTWIAPAKSFSQREFFALESLFKAHPHGCLLILSGSMDSRHGTHILKPLQDRGYRVVAVTPDLPYLFKNTSARAWFDEMKKGTRDPGKIPVAQNLSNLLRLAVLYKYGGVYMDTDFIVLKKLSGLRNSIGAQSINTERGSWNRLNNAVLIFDKNHPLLLNFIDEFYLNFDGNKWGHNGPYLVSRVVERVERNPGYCNFTVLPPVAFYPVGWNWIAGFFRQPRNPEMRRWVSAKLRQLSGEAYGIHLWNRQTGRLRIEEGSIIGRLISDHCVVCEHIYST
ncbi:PREDICTED: lactosylceramide 4-alpha-galactosyltransferase-like [Nelumbo nucifera]|uniref:Alpha 1,4-glycosyltransferase domain-containing protein n=2 Tax=Nelumbo nucifera TaxID=4432 RepID=A0A822YT10_NELNU|nr:PREDICTED: lactosylceramide 4-alpha-galactosyltransferase-like [Nelumbo nucifera]DAD37264.1 TPA_asm: hypothetical protein HUJ06_007905 [Nelumbo nucifera]